MGSLSVHVFAFGVMGWIIPAMLIRISNGHTGRKVVFDGYDRAVLYLMLAAFFARLLGPQLGGLDYVSWLLAAAAFPKSDKSLLLSIARSVCADHYRAIAARAVCVAIPEDFDLPDRADPITMGEWAQVLGMLGREDQILLAMRR